MWEDSIIIPATKTEFEVLKPVSAYLDQEVDIRPKLKQAELNKYIKRDKYPLPTVEDREGYGAGDRHYNFWLGGLDDFLKIREVAERNGLTIKKGTRIFDFGCASGRNLRHFALQSSSEAWGCDINENHVAWCNQFLPDSVKVFQNTSLPNLQIPDNFFDLAYAFSVFTHIENFETSWLAELLRVLKPGGLAYITVHDEHTWKSMPLTWGVGPAILVHPDFKKGWLKTGFPGEKLILRWDGNRSYSSNVFYKQSYLERVWGKFFQILEVIPNGSAYQTVMVLKKRR